MSTLQYHIIVRLVLLILLTTVSSFNAVRGGSFPDLIVGWQDVLKPEVAGIFVEVEKGIQQSRPDGIIAGIGRQVYLDLPGREGGYYSANQARFVLQEFFKQRKVLHFKIGTKGMSEGVPFATGGGTFIVKGVRGAFQVYLNLARHDDRWVISQFSMY